MNLINSNFDMSLWHLVAHERVGPALLTADIDCLMTTLELTWGARHVMGNMMAQLFQTVEGERPRNSNGAEQPNVVAAMLLQAASLQCACNSDVCQTMSFPHACQEQRSGLDSLEALVWQICCLGNAIMTMMHCMCNCSGFN